MAPIDDPQIFAEQAAMTLEAVRVHALHPWVKRGPFIRCIRRECVEDYRRATGADWGPPLLYAIDRGEAQ